MRGMTRAATLNRSYKPRRRMVCRVKLGNDDVDGWDIGVI